MFRNFFAFFLFLSMVVFFYFFRRAALYREVDMSCIVISGIVFLLMLGVAFFLILKDHFKDG